MSLSPNQLHTGRREEKILNGEMQIIIIWTKSFLPEW